MVTVTAAFARSAIPADEVVLFAFRTESATVSTGTIRRNATIVAQLGTMMADIGARARGRTELTLAKVDGEYI